MSLTRMGTLWQLWDLPSIERYEKICSGRGKWNNLRGIEVDFHLTSWIDIHRRWFVRQSVKRILHLKWQLMIIWKQCFAGREKYLLDVRQENDWFHCKGKATHTYRHETTSKKNRDNFQFWSGEDRVRNRNNTAYGIAFLFVWCWYPRLLVSSSCGINRLDWIENSMEKNARNRNLSTDVKQSWEVFEC